MSGRPAPPKPWERAGPSGAAATPASPTEGLPKPWETSSGADGSGAATIVPSSSTATPGGNPATPQAPRPWERSGDVGAGSSLATTNRPYGTTPYGSTMYGGEYGGYGTGAMYGASPYGTSMYGGAGGMYGSPYGSSMYGGGMYGGGMYGGGMYGGGMHGGGMYGRPMFGGGMYGPGASPMGPWDPNDPNGPPTPPSAWQAMLAGIGGIMHFFGRLSFLVDENAHAVHFFVTALLQLLDRLGSLYGELARFVLRLLGFKPKPKQPPPGMPGQHPPGAPGAPPQPGYSHAPHMPPHRPPPQSGQQPWDSVWGRR